MREANESLEGLFGGIVEFAKRLERKMKLAEEAGAIQKAIRVHKPSKASNSSKTSKSRVA